MILHDYISETPEKVARQMVQLADIQPHHTILEPGAGTGAILHAITVPHKSIEICELNQTNRNFLLDSFSRPVLTADFFNLPNYFKFDRIIMNPPQATDIRHVMKAACFHLKKGGRLVALLHDFWLACEVWPAVEFRQWIRSMKVPHKIIMLEPEDFPCKSPVNASILVIDAN